jgi:phosphoribosylformylglycinamidine cyclo-ligase
LSALTPPDADREAPARTQASLGEEGLSYAAAGVNIEAYQRMLERVRPLVESTHGAGAAAGIGAFAGLFELPGGIGHLAASADGVGTKVKVAIAAGSHRGIGCDLVNHCVNDIATAGAKPLFMLDYFAAGELREDVFVEVMTGLSESCLAAGCALLGGETAEMPSVYGLGDYDLAGFMVGLVPPGQLPDLDSVREGDLLVGLPSSGLHTNGYSLARKVFEGIPLESRPPGLGGTLAEELLRPHRSYLPELVSLRPDWKTAAHITGGGLLDNVPRALPEGLGARLRRGSWPVPPIFGVIQERGRVDAEEMAGTFNLGLGIVLVVAPEAASRFDGAEGRVVGEVVRRSGPRRVVIE